MKKVISLLLLLSFLVTAVACAKPADGTDAIDFGPGTTLAPGQTPPPGYTLSPDGTVVPDATLAPGETPDPNATLAPGVTPDPNATLAPGQTPGVSGSPAPSGPAPKSLSDAKKINSDVVGWIKIPNTNIDYPILYDKSGKFFYLTHDINKKSSESGSITSFYSEPTHNTIITGHNSRQSGTMLHELHKLQTNKSSLTTKANRTFSITFGNYSKWEVWALYETTDSEPASTLKNNTHPFTASKGSWSTQEIEDWIAKQKSRSEIDLGVSVSPEDVIMTLYTCGDNYDYSDAQSRLYFFLKAVS